MIQTLSITLAALLFVAVFIVFVRWRFGWAALEHRYASDTRQHDDETPEASFDGAPASAGFARMSLSVDLYPASLWLKPAFPLSVGMKAIDVPWSAVEKATVRKGWFGSGTELRVSGAGVPFTIGGRAGKRILELAAARCPDRRDAQSASANN